MKNNIVNAVGRFMLAAAFICLTSCQQNSTVEVPVTASITECGLTSVNPYTSTQLRILSKSWSNSFEEETCDSILYFRPTDTYAFPPAPFRMVYQLLPTFICYWSNPDSTTGQTLIQGSWNVRGSVREPILTIGEYLKKPQAQFQIRLLSDTLLVVKK